MPFKLKINVRYTVGPRSSYKAKMEDYINNPYFISQTAPVS